MSEKTKFFSKNEINNIDFFINEQQKFNWNVSEKKVINFGIEVTLTRDSDTKELLEAEEEFELLNNEYDKLYKILNKLLDNEFHNISKGLLFVCFTAFNLYLCVLFLLMFINPDASILFKISYVVSTCFSLFLCYKFYSLLFVLNKNKINETRNKIEIIKLKKHNLVAKMNNNG